jgi:hypothetical protein
MRVLITALAATALVATGACGSDSATSGDDGDAGPSGPGTTTGDAAATTPSDASTQPPGTDAGVDEGAPPGPVDAVIAAMAPGSWKELPSTHMADVCPPPYSSYTCGAVMLAWSGGAYDGKHDRLFIAGGGHADSYYDNVFVFDLGTMKWRRATELAAGTTGDTVPPIVQDKRPETCGLYPSGATLDIPPAWLTASGYVMPDKCNDPTIVAQLDAQHPRSRHTYGNLAFSDATNRFYLLGGPGLYPSGQSATTRVDGFDPVTSKFARYADNTTVGYGTAATDGSGNVWYLGAAGSTKLAKYDVATNAWQAQASDSMGSYYGGAAVDTMRNVLAVTADGTSVYSYALAQAGAPLTTHTATALPVALGQAPGFEYAKTLDRFVAWSGGAAVSMLDPATWAWAAAPATGDVPAAAPAQGTFGRFRYSRHRNVFVAVSSTTTNVFLYKPPAAAP